MTIQLPLPFHFQEFATFENFYPGNNQPLLNYLDLLIKGQGERYVYLWGAKGVGRSHLLQACCQRASENNLSALYLSFQQIDELEPKILENLANFSLICLDDIQLIAGKKQWEEAVFHFYNHLESKQTRLLISGNVLPKSLPIRLNDLASRLGSGVILQLQGLNDADKIKALQARAEEKGLELPAKVGEFMLSYLTRDLDSLLAALEKLDQVSLIEQRKLTIPFVKKILKIKA